MYFNSKDQYKFGTRVEITEGPLAGLEGTVEKVYREKRRCKIKIDFYDKAFPIDIGFDVLRNISDEIEKVNEIANEKEIIINNSILERIENIDDVFRITPYQFEDLISEILEKEGFLVHTTKRSHDGGRDILSILKTPIGEMLTIVECKQYSKNRKVGIEIAQRLMWICEHEDYASKAMIVTSSEFTRGCYDLKNKYRYKLELKNINDIVEWISKYGKIRKIRNSYMWSPIIDL